MFQMVVERLYVPDLSKVEENEKKLCAVAVTHLLCNADSMISGVYFDRLWLMLCQALLRLFQSSQQLQILSVAERKQQEQEQADEELIVGLDETPGQNELLRSEDPHRPSPLSFVDYTPAFSCLAFAKKPSIDLVGSNIPDARCHLAKCLQTLTSSHPHQVRLVHQHEDYSSSAFHFQFLSAMSRGLTSEQLAQIQSYCALANVTLT